MNKVNYIESSFSFIGAQFAIKERELIRERCKKMIELGVNVVINQGQIFSVAEQ